MHVNFKTKVDGIILIDFLHDISVRCAGIYPNILAYPVVRGIAVSSVLVRIGTPAV